MGSSVCNLQSSGRSAKSCTVCCTVCIKKANLERSARNGPSSSRNLKSGRGGGVEEAGIEQGVLKPAKIKT